MFDLNTVKSEIAPCRWSWGWIRVHLIGVRWSREVEIKSERE